MQRPYRGSVRATSSASSIRFTWRTRLLNNSAQLIRRAILVLQILIRGFVIGKTLCFAVPLEIAPGAQRDVGDHGRRGGAVSDFNVAVAPGPRLHAVQGIASVDG